MIGITEFLIFLSKIAPPIIYSLRQKSRIIFNMPMSLTPVLNNHPLHPHPHTTHHTPHTTQTQAIHQQVDMPHMDPQFLNYALNILFQTILFLTYNILNIPYFFTLKQWNPNLLSWLSRPCLIESFSIILFYQDPSYSISCILSR